MEEDERLKEQNKIIGNARLRPPITFMTVVFALILVYLVVQTILLATRDRIQAYEVGTPVSDNVSGSYTGIVLREEHVSVAPEGGYVSCFSVNGERLSSGSTVCTLDETGLLETALRSMYFGEQMLSEDSKVRIRDMVRDSMYGYSRLDFGTAEDIGTAIRAAVFNGLIKDADSTAKTALYSSCTPVVADESGFVLFSLDGYEYTVPSGLSLSDFTGEKPAAETVNTGDQVLAGQFLYKIVPGNQFSLVFPLSEQEAVRFSGRKTLTVRLDGGLEITGKFSEATGQDGTALGVLYFQKYGANLLNARRVSFFLLDTSVTGYKIPESAIVKKSFFTVDRSFITEGGGSGARGVLIEEDGKVTFREVTVYMSDSDSDSRNDFIIGSNTAYIAGDCLEAGTVLVAPETGDSPLETTERKTALGVQAVIEGVYQINSGYCVFRPVARLSSSLETSYVIVSPGIRNGISDFDRIVLNAENVSEYELIYQ